MKRRRGYKLTVNDYLHNFARRHLPGLREAEDLVAVLRAAAGGNDPGDENHPDYQAMDIDDEDSDAIDMLMALSDASIGRMQHRGIGGGGYSGRVYSNRFDSSGTFLDHGSHSNAPVKYKMPRRAYYRGRLGRKRYIRRRRGGRRRNYVMSTRKIQKVINRNVELKFLDLVFPETTLTATALAFGTSGYLSPLTHMAQGASISERIASKVKQVSLQVKGRFTTQTDGFAKTDQRSVRIIIFVEKASEGLAPIIGDVLAEDVTTASASTGKGDNIMSLKDLERGGAFYILWDKLYTMGGASHPEEVKFHKKIRLSRTMSYHGTGNGMANCWLNHVFMWICHDDNAAGGVHANIRTRLRFRDA